MCIGRKTKRKTAFIIIHLHWFTSSRRIRKNIPLHLAGIHQSTQPTHHHQPPTLDLYHYHHHHHFDLFRTHSRTQSHFQPFNPHRVRRLGPTSYMKRKPQLVSVNGKNKTDSYGEQRSEWMAMGMSRVTRRKPRLRLEWWREKGG